VVELELEVDVAGLKVVNTLFGDWMLVMIQEASV
jgi:hypothetical protein